MTIRRRFLISFLGGIIIAVLAILSLFSIMFYTITGQTPSAEKAYKVISKERKLSNEEELGLIELRKIAQDRPTDIVDLANPQLLSLIKTIESQELVVVIRQNEQIVYYSDDVVEKSLLAHLPGYELNNLQVRGTIDNAGRLYTYIKYDFRVNQKSQGGVLILKKEATFFEFLKQWGLQISLLIMLVSLLFFMLLHYFITKTVIRPLDHLKDDVKLVHKENLADETGTIKVNPKNASEINELIGAFEEMRSQLNHSLKEQAKYEENRRELIANISHDLRTPMTSIIGYVEGLQDGVATTKEKQDAYLGTIHRKSLTLNEMIEELFLLSKLDLDKVEFRFEQIDLVKFMSHIVEEYQSEMSEQGISLTSVIEVKGSLFIKGDRLQLSRVMNNLLHNSMKFKDSQKEKNKVTITVLNDEGHVLIKVSDNGIGIPKEKQAYIFERFYRSEDSRNLNQGGSGLGLAIVSQIINYHEGELSLESQEGVGTTITLAFKEVDSRKVESR